MLHRVPEPGGSRVTPPKECPDVAPRGRHSRIGVVDSYFLAHDRQREAPGCADAPVDREANQMPCTVVPFPSGAVVFKRQLPPVCWDRPVDLEGIVESGSGVRPGRDTSEVDGSAHERVRGAAESVHLVAFRSVDPPSPSQSANDTKSHEDCDGADSIRAARVSPKHRVIVPDHDASERQLCPRRLVFLEAEELEPRRAPGVENLLAEAVAGHERSTHGPGQADQAEGQEAEPERQRRKHSQEHDRWREGAPSGTVMPFGFGVLRHRPTLP